MQEVAPLPSARSMAAAAALGGRLQGTVNSCFAGKRVKPRWMIRQFCQAVAAFGSDVTYTVTLDIMNIH